MSIEEITTLYNQLDEIKYSIIKQEEKDTSKIKKIRKKIAVLKTIQSNMEKKSG